MPETRPLFTVGAFAIIFDDAGRVLLCHRRDMDAWNLPGGGLEPHELPDQCVLREIREETGLEAEVERLVGIYGKAERNELVFAFICRVIGGTLALTDESDANQYFASSALPTNILAKHVERITDAIAARANQSPPVFRLQSNQRAGIA